MGDLVILCGKQPLLKVKIKFFRGIILSGKYKKRISLFIVQISIQMMHRRTPAHFLPIQIQQKTTIIL